MKRRAPSYSMMSGNALPGTGQNCSLHAMLLCVLSRVPLQDVTCRFGGKLTVGTELYRMVERGTGPPVETGAAVGDAAGAILNTAFAYDCCLSAVDFAAVPARSTRCLWFSSCMRPSASAARSSSCSISVLFTEVSLLATQQCLQSML